MIKEALCVQDGVRINVNRSAYFEIESSNVIDTDYQPTECACVCKCINIKCM